MVYCSVDTLDDVLLGLNIEGCRPYAALPPSCKWYNLVVAVDRPLCGFTFDQLMKFKNIHNCDLIETAAGMDRETFLHQVLTLANHLQKQHSNFLIHVHQYEGSTALMDILKENGFRVISDGTNFYDNPTNYAKDYPEVDGVLSLSQCAGLLAKAGEWILPTGYHFFDIHASVISNTTPPFINSLYSHREFLKDLFPTLLEGPLLVVDDLWNPSSEDLTKTVLLLDEEATKVLDFVKENTKCFDDSHSWVHAVQVAKTAVEIDKSKDTLYLALLHDVCDHKYPEALPRTDLSAWIHTNLPSYTHIDAMIDQVSYSTQVKKEGSTPLPCSIPSLAAVRDADRIEALGQIGITRCLTFCRTKLEEGQDPLPPFIHHAYEKLLRLLPNNFISTPKGKALAQPGHDQLVGFISAILPAYPDLLAAYGFP